MANKGFPDGWCLFAIFMFAGLCSTNCLAIAKVEAQEDAVHDPMAVTHLQSWWIKRLAVVILIGCLLSSGLWLVSSNWLFAAMALGWLGLLLIDQQIEGSKNWRRVAADCCLFTPLPWLIFLVG